MRVIKVTYDNGQSITTSVNSKMTDQDIEDYFLGQEFNLGSGENDLMAMAISVEAV